MDTLALRGMNGDTGGSLTLRAARPWRGCVDVLACKLLRLVGNQ
jgi:hypothetical protein